MLTTTHRDSNSACAVSIHEPTESMTISFNKLLGVVNDVIEVVDRVGVVADDVARLDANAVGVGAQDAVLGVGERRVGDLEVEVLGASGVFLKREQHAQNVGIPDDQSGDVLGDLDERPLEHVGGKRVERVDWVGVEDANLVSEMLAPHAVKAIDRRTEVGARVQFRDVEFPVPHPDEKLVIGSTNCDVDHLAKEYLEIPRAYIRIFHRKTARLLIIIPTLNVEVDNVGPEDLAKLERLDEKLVVRFSDQPHGDALWDLH